MVPRTLSRTCEPMIAALSSPVAFPGGCRLAWAGAEAGAGASVPEEAGVSAPLLGGGATWWNVFWISRSASSRSASDSAASMIWLGVKWKYASVMSGLNRRISRVRCSAAARRDCCVREGIWLICVSWMVRSGWGWDWDSVTYLNVWERAQLHHGALQRAEGVLHVEREPEALAEQELASEDLVGVFPAERPDETRTGSETSAVS